MGDILTYDFLAIGSGVAGTTAVIECAKNNLKTAIVDNKPYGGTCPLRGSDPKKILLGAAELYEWFGRMKDKGVVTGEIKINWRNLIKYKCGYTENIPSQVKETLNDMKIDSFNGNATFMDRNTVKINDTIIRAKNILIATGSIPAKLSFEGAELMSSSDEFLALKDLPARIIFVGGGFISLEFAQAAARAGAESIIIHSGSRILEAFDNDLVNLISKATESSGIKIILNNRVSRIEKIGSVFTARLTPSNKEIEADMIMHGAGRVANVYNMQLEKGNIAFDKSGIKVNEYLQNITNNHIYAAGDVSSTDGAYLATVAAMEGRIAAANIISGNHQQPSYENIPSAVFTIPTMASVGMSEDDAKKAGYNYESRFQETANWFTSYRIGEQYSAFKIIKDINTDKILGAHLLGNACEEVINLFTFGIKNGLTATQMKNSVYTYPTASSDIIHML